MFLEVDEDFPDHPKTRHFCRLIQHRQGWSWIILLWRFCTKYAKDGDLTSLGAEGIEFNLDWTLGEGKLYDALVGAGFIDVLADGRLVVHDWDKHQGKWIRKLEADRRAAKERREGRRRTDAKTDEPVSLYELAETEKQEELPIASASASPETSVGATSVRRRCDVGAMFAENRTSVGDSIAKQSLAKLSEADPREEGARAPVYSAEFETAWSAYPTYRGSKHDAWRAWRRQKPALDAVLGGIERWKKHPDWMKNGGEFIPGMGPWLNKRAWETEIMPRGSPGLSEREQRGQRNVQAWLEMHGVSDG